MHHDKHNLSTRINQLSNVDSVYYYNIAVLPAMQKSK